MHFFMTFILVADSPLPLCILVLDSAEFKYFITWEFDIRNEFVVRALLCIAQPFLIHHIRAISSSQAEYVLHCVAKALRVDLELV